MAAGDEVDLEVGAEDLELGELDAEGAEDEAEAGPEEAGEAPPRPPVQRPSRLNPTAKQRPAQPARQPAEAVKKEVPTPARKPEPGAVPRRRPAPEALGPRTERELFVERKRTESTLRDTACKAICKIKHGLRQPGAQEDGRPLIPEEWDKLFKPMLGSYIKFLLSRPDQFRVVEGSGPGFYTVDDVTMNKTVVAPVWGKGKDTGKGKSFKGSKGFKGMKGVKGVKGKGKDGPSKGMSQAFAGKASNGKGKGHEEAPCKGKGKDKSTGKVGKARGKGALAVTLQPPRKPPPAAPPTKAALLLAEAAREALAGEQPASEELEDFGEEAEEEARVSDMEAGTPEADEGDEAGGAEAEAEAEAGAEEQAEGQEEDEEAVGLPAVAEDENEDEDPSVQKAAKHGSYINLLLSGGLLSSLGSHKRPASGEGPASDAKRAR
mmetsp:Transcript_28436/g.90582  ORF Transcript_28436/g.90582 Transcript_28436/m.90582 type:complete len:435 (+) Transcript_28436:118-1422(+)